MALQVSCLQLQALAVSYRAEALSAGESHIHGEGPDGSTSPAKGQLMPDTVGLEQQEQASGESPSGQGPVRVLVSCDLYVRARSSRKRVQSWNPVPENRTPFSSHRLWRLQPNGQRCLTGMGDRCFGRRPTGYPCTLISRHATQASNCRSPRRRYSLPGATYLG